MAIIFPESIRLQVKMRTTKSPCTKPTTSFGRTLPRHLQIPSWTTLQAPTHPQTISWPKQQSISTPRSRHFWLSSQKCMQRFLQSLFPHPQEMPVSRYILMSKATASLPRISPQTRKRCFMITSSSSMISRQESSI